MAENWHSTIAVKRKFDKIPSACRLLSQNESMTHITSENGKWISQLARCRLFCEKVLEVLQCQRMQSKIILLNIFVHN